MQYTLNDLEFSPLDLSQYKGEKQSFRITEKCYNISRGCTDPDIDDSLRTSRLANFTNLVMRRVKGQLTHVSRFELFCLHFKQYIDEYVENPEATRNKLYQKRLPPYDFLEIAQMAETLVNHGRLKLIYDRDRIEEAKLIGKAILMVANKLF